MKKIKQRENRKERKIDLKLINYFYIFLQILFIYFSD